MRKKIVAGNWKMNTSFAEGKKLAEDILVDLKNINEGEDVILIPPFTHLSGVGELINNTSLSLGAQNCHVAEKGAYTGEISAKMLKSVGTNYCLVGHSERRTYNKETDEELKAKLQALFKEGIGPIFCCGEQLEDRKSGNYKTIIDQQLSLLWELSKEEFNQLILAYEPVWAIGTGETASADQAQEIHKFIRASIEAHFDKDLADNTTILYGGSCKPTNAEELFSKEDVDGGLIGGAALKADDFLAIVNSL